jgi:hypothetical protein
MMFPVCKTKCYKLRELCGQCTTYLGSCKEFPSGNIGKECKVFVLKIKKAYYNERRKHKKTKKTPAPAPVDNLAVVAARYGVQMSGDRRSVARACLKACHPDKKADFDDQNKSDLAFLVEQMHH